MKMGFKLKGTRMGLKMQAYGRKGERTTATHIWGWRGHLVGDATHSMAGHPCNLTAKWGGRSLFDHQIIVPHMSPWGIFSPPFNCPYTLKRVISNIFVVAYTESFFCIKESLIPFSALFSALKITILWWIKHWCWTIDALHEGLEEINEPLSQLVKPW